MAVKYQICLSSFDVDAEIFEVTVERETEKSVWINGNHTAKRSQWKNFFDTWDEAKKMLTDHQSQRVNSLRRQLEKANGKLGNIKGLVDTTAQ